MIDAHVTYYNPKTGRIARRQRIAEGEEPQPREGEAWKWGRHDSTLERIDPATGEAVLLCEAEIVITGNRIDGVPKGARVSIGAVAFEASGKPIEAVASVEEEVRVRIGHEDCLHTERTIALDPAANKPKAKGAQVIEVRQNPVRMRMRHYRDGDTMDALCKFAAEVLEAHPELTGPGATEMRAILAQRAEVKARLPKPESKP